jgi:hypothetical protein
VAVFAYILVGCGTISISSFSFEAPSITTTSCGRPLVNVIKPEVPLVSMILDLTLFPCSTAYIICFSLQKQPLGVTK